MSMKVASLISAGNFRLEERDIPVPEGDQVIIRVEACGVCSSEIPIFDGSLVGTPGVSFRYTGFPADLGHEVAGVVSHVGPDVKNLREGDRVTGLTYSGCGFAEYFRESETMLVKIPDGWKGDLKHAIGEPLVATINILRQVSVEYGDSVLVVGDGYMSLLLIAALSRQCLSKLIVIGHHDNRLDLARKFGACHTINGKACNAWEAIMDLTGGAGVDVAVEYAGSPSALQLAASVCKAKVRAKLVLAAAYDNSMPFTIGNYLQNRAPVLIPAYPNQTFDRRYDMERAMWALEAGIFPIGDLLTHEYRLEETGQAYQDCIARLPGYIKGIVTP